MKRSAIELIGSVAGFLTTISMVPQVIKIAKTKATAGLSIWYFSLLLTGVILWVMYGALIGSPSLIIANTVSASLVSFIVYSIIKYGEKR